LRRGIPFIGTVQKAYLFLKHGQRQQRERGDYTSVKAAGFFVSSKINPVSKIIVVSENRREKVLVVVDSAKNFSNIQIKFMADIF
jgi:hypothetical protein